MPPSIQLFLSMLPMFVVAVLPSKALAQTPSPLVLERVSQEIRTKNPRASEALLAQDKLAIQAAFPSLYSTLLAKGFVPADVSSAVAAGWLNYRAQPGNLAALNPELVQASVDKLGRLRIESDPPEARVEINGERQEELTNTARWLASGRYRIVLTKDGYLPAEESREIRRGSNPPLIKVLQPIPKK